MNSWRKFAVGILLTLVGSPAFLFAHPQRPRSDFPALSLIENPFSFDSAEDVQDLSVEKSGRISTRQGHALRVTAELGDVHVFTDESKHVSYHVVVRADSRDPGAEEFLRQFTLDARRFAGGVSIEARLPWRTFHGRFSLSMEVHVPRQYNVKIDTQGGNIQVQDLEGPVDLFTGGGNITASNVNPRVVSNASRVEYVAARLETRGGHIAIGDVTGTLRATTSGGHIFSGDIAGDAVLRTGGGQTRAGRISGTATLSTGGGNVYVASAGSSVTAYTAGGRIEFGEAGGEIRTNTEGGAIHIGRITGPAAISSGQGDIVVYLRRELAATIHAIVEQGNGHRIITDPGLPLRISYQNSGSGSRAIRGEGNFNGGGEVLRLKATSGNIVLKLGEPAKLSAISSAHWRPGAEPSDVSSDSVVAEEFTDSGGLFEEFRRRIVESWYGGVPVDAAEMQKHLEYSVAPVYPDVARSAGVEGDVTMQVYISSDGRVSGIRVLEGPPILARAAVDAVRQWRYQVVVINGRPATVVTTLMVAFRLK